MWTPDVAKRARKLVETTSLYDAAATLSKELGRSVTGNALRVALYDAFPGWTPSGSRRTSADASVRAESLTATNKVVATENKRLRAEADKRAADDAEVEALRRVAAVVEPPKWLAPTASPVRGPGVPTLELCDWHTGEVVRPELVAGKNAYNKDIQRARVKNLLSAVLDLTQRHMVNPVYPGIVVPLAGDMFSGDIHDELTATNWGDAREVMKEAVALVIGLLDPLADAFPDMFIPIVTGNHPRMTKKMQHKRRTGTSMDAILGDAIAEHFANSKHVKVVVAEGASMLYRVYDHRYLLAHGDPASTGARGGDGFIGAVGPIVRGVKKLAARADQLGMAFDTAIFGHYHQRIIHDHVIVGASLKGFDEYAMNNGYDYAPASQNLWFTHPERGVTCYWPVYVDPKKSKKRQGSWVGLFDDTGKGVDNE